MDPGIGHLLGSFNGAAPRARKVDREHQHAPVLNTSMGPRRGRGREVLVEAERVVIVASMGPRLEDTEGPDVIGDMAGRAGDLHIRPLVGARVPARGRLAPR